MSKRCFCGRRSRGFVDHVRTCYHCVAAQYGWDANDWRLRMRVSDAGKTWVPDVVVRRERWVFRAELCGVLLIGVGIVALSLGGHYHLCASGLCKGASSWQMGLSIFVGMTVIYALVARETFFPFCRELRDELRDYVATFHRR